MVDSNYGQTPDPDARKRRTTERHMTKNDWFRVDKGGLAQVYARRGPAAPFFELISNAWDEVGVTEVTLEVTAVRGKPEVVVLVIDDSTEGFRDLEEARTLFAPSYKKGDAERRGRFNIGEKLFLSLCTSARITSTGGTLEFRSDGRVRRSKTALDIGTEVHATMRMTRADALEAFEELGRLISPTGIDTYIRFIGFYPDEDGPDTMQHERFAASGGRISFRAKLQSELADLEGVLRPTERVTEVNVWKLTDDERRDRNGILFEMGIPIRELDGPFDVNVMQKIPLTVDRDNVRPAFLRRLQAELFNSAWREIKTQDEANEAWVTEAISSSSPKPDADGLNAILDLRFGRRRVSYDPSDKEGSQLAMSKGYTVVHGGSLPREVWENVREHETIRPAGQVTPSSRAVFSEHGEDVSIPREKYPLGGIEVCDAFARLGSKLIGEPIEVRIVKRLQSRLLALRAPAACYGNHTILLNLRSLTKAWFQDAIDATVLMPKHVKLLVHELGHEYSGSHLNEKFHESQTELGVALAFMVIGEGKAVLSL